MVAALARYHYEYAETRAMFFGLSGRHIEAIAAKDGSLSATLTVYRGLLATRGNVLSNRNSRMTRWDAHQHERSAWKTYLRSPQLDPHEQELMRRHPIYGAKILEPSESLRPLVPLVMHHHENFDGSGYPDGRKGEDIPLGSRIIIVADAYEAMTSDRIYRKAIGHDRAMDQLNRYKGIQFDPQVVRALGTLLDKHGAEAFEVSELPPINYETLAELRKRLAREPMARDAHAG